MTDEYLSQISIRKMVSTDIEALADVFEVWHKTMDKFEQYYLDQLLEKRLVLVARHPVEGITGYTTILWKSGYTYFWQRHIPEIADLNVMRQFQRRGIGSALISACETWAKQRGHSTIGISVVQDDEYAPAQRLYLALGFAPDGRGITPEDNELHLIKSL